MLEAGMFDPGGEGAGVVQAGIRTREGEGLKPAYLT